MWVGMVGCHGYGFPYWRCRDWQDGCWKKKKKKTQTTRTLWQPHSFLLLKAMYPFCTNDSSSSMQCNLETLIFL